MLLPCRVRLWVCRDTRPGSYLGHAALYKPSIAAAAASAADNRCRLTAEGRGGMVGEAAGFYANSPGVGLSPACLLSLHVLFCRYERDEFSPEGTGCLHNSASCRARADGSSGEPRPSPGSISSQKRLLPRSRARSRCPALAPGLFLCPPEALRFLQTHSPALIRSPCSPQDQHRAPAPGRSYQVTSVIWRRRA